MPQDDAGIARAGRGFVGRYPAPMLSGRRRRISRPTLVAFLVPYAVQYLGNHIAPGALTGAFSAVNPGVWYFLDFFQLGYGLPLLISAGVSRFLIRRLPVIG